MYRVKTEIVNGVCKISYDGFLHESKQLESFSTSIVFVRNLSTEDVLHVSDLSIPPSTLRDVAKAIRVITFSDDAAYSVGAVKHGDMKYVARGLSESLASAVAGAMRRAGLEVDVFKEGSES